MKENLSVSVPREAGKMVELEIDDWQQGLSGPNPRGPVEPSESLDGQEDLYSREKHASGNHMPEFEPQFVGNIYQI
ncbi:unnamed protein product [Schistocephalus solidus]|uniref:Uncharacterized protein n=1 Tax=Schistocephalus solidus TaxID=70667 RepID=A0A183TK61_SCHSO|nr:unnamed protein product [Schistocephalus solidus]